MSYKPCRIASILRVEYGDTAGFNFYINIHAGCYQAESTVSDQLNSNVDKMTHREIQNIMVYFNFYGYFKGNNTQVIGYSSFHNVLI